MLGYQLFPIPCTSSTKQQTVRVNLLHFEFKAQWVFIIGYTKYFENDLVGGWSWVGRKVDTSDYEWNVWSPILLKWLCYVVPFIVFSTILKRILPNFVTLTSIALSFCWLYSLLGLPLTVFIYTQPMLLLFISKLSSIIVVWIVVLSFTLGLHLSVFNELKVNHYIFCFQSRLFYQQYQLFCSSLAVNIWGRQSSRILFRRSPGVDSSALNQLSHRYSKTIQCCKEC